MRSRKSPTSPPLSRRAVLAAPAGFAAGGASASQPPAADDAERLCRLWLANERETRRLIYQWGDIEADLIERCGWCSLSEAEQDTSALGAPLRAIDAQLDALSERREAIARRLPLVPATSSRGVFFKLDIVGREMHEEGYSMAHLHTSAVRDLRSLWR